jgi:ribosome-associated heat shock protein Hsp15
LEKKENIRADKWLWSCRFFKTRALSSKMLELGKVRLNGRKLRKPSSSVRIGDVLTLSREGEILIIKVLSLPLRRGSAKNSELWYENV